MIRLVRRPAFPGELNHELVWPLAFLGGATAAFLWFQTGWHLPDCLFFDLTGLPCLGCGGTRCARHLSQGHLLEAFFFHPGFFLLVVAGALWTLHSSVFWLRRDTLRLRLAVDEAGERHLRWGLLGLAVAHWLWQCHYLAR